MSANSSNRSSEIPPEIAFISLPKGLAQFHHLPTHVPVWTRDQAEVEKKGYDFQEGVAVMEGLLKSAPGAPGAYLYQLFVNKWRKLVEVNPYFESNRIAEAIPKLIEILNIDPECPLTSFQLGYCFRATGELEKSESFYKQALRMAPDAGWIWSNLGRTYQAMGDKTRAGEAFWKALELLPGDHFVLEQLLGLGEIFLSTPGGKNDGEVLFTRRSDHEKKKKAEMNGEKDSQRLLILGGELLQDGLFDLACQCFEKILTDPEKKQPARLGLGTAHLEAGRFKEAERFLGEYLDENPGSAAAHLNLFKVYLAQDERDLAWEEILTAVQLDPNHLDALRQIYFLYRETGRLEECFELLDRLALENPMGYAPLLIKAGGLAGLNDWEGAEKTLRESLRRAPQQEEILFFYTAELGKRGKQGELIELLEKGSPTLPLSLTINLALAYSQMGQAEKGKQYLRKFLARPGLAPLEKKRAGSLLDDFERNS